MANNKKVPTTFDSLYKRIDKKRNNYNKFFIFVLLIIAISVVSRSYYLNKNLHVSPNEKNVTVTVVPDSAKKLVNPVKKEYKRRIKQAAAKETANSSN